MKRPRNGHSEPEEVEVENCGSSQGRADPLATFSRKDLLPNVPKFARDAAPTSQGSVFVPPISWIRQILIFVLSNMLMV